MKNKNFNTASEDKRPSQLRHDKPSKKVPARLNHSAPTDELPVRLMHSKGGVK